MIEHAFHVMMWKYNHSYTIEEPAAAAFSEQGIVRVRDVAERAITAGGLHVTQGGRLWDQWRSYEEHLRQHLQGMTSKDQVPQ